MGNAAKLHHLLTVLTIGDYAPSQLLGKMKQFNVDKVSVEAMVEETCEKQTRHPDICRFGESGHVVLYHRDITGE